MGIEANSDLMLAATALKLAARPVFAVVKPSDVIISAPCVAVNVPDATAS